MKIVFSFLYVVTLTSAFARPCEAQTLRLGLWEEVVQPNMGGSSQMSDIVRKMEESKRQMKEKLAALGPEKRSAVEKEMEASGVDLQLDKPNGAIATRQCMTPKEQERLATEAQKPNCKRTVTSKADGIVEVSLQCMSKAGKQSNATFTYFGDKAYVVTSPTATVQARWLSDDCGSLAK